MTKGMMQRIRMVAVAALFATLGTAQAARGVVAASTYTVTALPITWAGGGSRPAAINERGDVTGTDGLEYNNEAFLYHPGAKSLQDLGVLPGDLSSYGYALNDQGDVVGESDGVGEAIHAFLYRQASGRMTAIGFLPGGNQSRAFGINDCDQVVGYSWYYQPGQPGTQFRAFLYDARTGRMTDLGLLPGGTYSVATGINAQGVVVGYADGADFLAHAFESYHGIMTDLGALPTGSFSEALAINDKRQVVGFSDDVRDAGLCEPDGEFGFIASGAGHGTMTRLGVTGTEAGNCASQAHAINNRGEVVGLSGGASLQDGAIIRFSANGVFLYAHGTMTDLNAGLTGTGYVLLNVEGINDAGRVLGSGFGPDGYEGPLVVSLAER